MTVVLYVTATNSAEVVTYFDPFDQYLIADILRMFVLLWAVCVGASVLLVARHRWTEQRQSAAMFLLALTLASATFGAAGLIGLGRPPVWWYLGMELAVLALTTAACLSVISEAKRGIWARRS